LLKTNVAIGLRSPSVTQAGSAAKTKHAISKTEINLNLFIDFKVKPSKSELTAKNAQRFNMM
jgi:hypothetical protein